ncbi:mycofactocin system GMC family oxidoreductase MftG [Mycolicibacillus parakoreensis]|uniref:Mycofactocin system GMC family oxidoreductase MftG n=1 Tax=Mycolicibacillus parakoreensis TaxID=1069221 RepID=A0ABY3U0H5_9MYCO|nr:mycofactocin system GMC family oxidoreductase MftG [Mycolicibacillus parakoreensis]MCV7315370.1 mycofactocin system GMC family oxidoreductase MftG [Mycolicibacillus parakoreensis]ULN52161.1 mycofactocin system GMC family oxidoreductase MftG [Mycolicibacillus parakoreensis]
MTTPTRDVVVIGAGSAGSIVAARLAADPACAVTVIEAGPRPPAGTQAAGRLPLADRSAVARRYRTRLTANPPRWAHVIGGHTVGGSGAVNGGYFCRAVPADFDAGWPTGWSWPQALDHFRALEDDLDFTGPAHGRGGRIAVRRSRDFAGVTASFAAAARRAGFRWIPDLNDAGRELPEGFGSVPLNIVQGNRIDTGAAFLSSVAGQPNVTVLTDTTATRLRIIAGRAVGVEVYGPGGLETIAADRIVLCAGTIGSARLLMLSGVGDEEMLRELGIAVAQPLPVGLSCADHPEWLFAVDWPTVSGRPPLEIVLSTPDGLEIRPYTTGFAEMTAQSPGLHSDPAHIGVSLMRPRGRVRLALASADPRVAPRIEHDYDREPADVAELARGALLVEELVGASGLTPVWATSQHLCASAPMGQVIDERCRVHGVDGLWVIDGAALPAIPSRGPHATIAMLAHRAVEFVGAAPLNAPQRTR